MAIGAAGRGGGAVIGGTAGTENRGGGAANGIVAVGARAATRGAGGGLGRAAGVASGIRSGAAAALAPAATTPTENTVRHTEHRARTPPAGTFAGSTRKTV
ncbi:MAG: hypothetical protein ABSG61_15085 [Gemmatimonadales bacterium]